jgi:hypothetical protein
VALNTINQTIRKSTVYKFAMFKYYIYLILLRVFGGIYFAEETGGGVFE